MNNNLVHYNTDFSILSTKDCIEYLEKCGIPIDSESMDSISSNRAIVFFINKEEVALLPSNLDPEYPSIIFKSKDAYRKYKQRNYFPIPIEYMDWRESVFPEMSEFPQSGEFYLKNLKKVGIVKGIDSDEEAIAGFRLVKNQIKKNIGDRNESYSFDLVHCYALALTQFLVNKHGFFLRKQFQYSNYNPYIVVEVTKGGKTYNVATLCQIYLFSYGENSETAFFRSIELI